MTNLVLMDAFRAQMAKDATKQTYPSVAVSLYAVAPQPEYSEIRCLIAERTASPDETVITCSPMFDKTGVDTQPDNIQLTLRADGTYVNDSQKMAIWVGTDGFKQVCHCDVPTVASDARDGDQEVTCDLVHTDKGDPSFILSKISEDDRTFLSSVKPSDAANMYRLYTNEGNMCRVIDHNGHVTCVTDSNELANNNLGVYFKVLPN